eukprot:135637_1
MQSTLTKPLNNGVVSISTNRLSTNFVTYQTINTKSLAIYPTSKPFPDGSKTFTLNAVDRAEKEECIQCIPFLKWVYIILPGALLIGALACFILKYIAAGVIQVMLAVAVTIFGCCFILNKKRPEIWAKYIMIVNIDKRMIYLIVISDKKRWKQIGTIQFSEWRSVGIEAITRTYSGCVCDESAFVIFSLTGGTSVKFNTIPCKIVSVQSFVERVGVYMQQVTANNQQVATNDRQMDQTSEQYHDSLRTLIRRLKLNSDENIVNQGIQLDVWYEKQKVVMINEYMDIVNEGHNDNDIVKLLLLKCKTMENVYINNED